MAVALPDITTARLPDSYRAACTALEACSKLDECQDWADRMAALASYARQAEDEELFRYARRIQARAVRRTGELLKEIEPQRGGDRGNAATGGRLPVAETRKAAAELAGLSDDQRKQALRVASIEPGEFERQLDAANPPSVSELAEQGTQRKPAFATVDLGSRTPEQFKAATALIGAVEQFVRNIPTLAESDALVGLDPIERARIRGALKAIKIIVNTLLQKLESEDGLRSTRT